MKSTLMCLLMVACVSATAGIITVTNTADDGPGSLRWAISNANAYTDFDAIIFNIGPPGGVKTIKPLSRLPRITSSVVITGGSQPGYTNTPLIELDGSMAGCATGLEIAADGCMIHALSIHSFQSCIGDPFAGFQILIKGGNSNQIMNCFVGLTPSGGIPPPPWSPVGIKIYESHDNQIGDSSSGGNVISANFDPGLKIEGPQSMNNVVEGNYIGTDPSGTLDRGNQGHGILIAGSAYNRVGGELPGARNVISCNISNGVTFQAGAAFNEVIGNLIGTDWTGSLPLGNHGNGIGAEWGNSNYIRSQNVICDNFGDGISLGPDPSATIGWSQGNVIYDNRIGETASGDPLGNHGNGVRVTGVNSSGNVIGTPNAPNVIGYNSMNGVSINGPQNTVETNTVEWNHLDGIFVAGNLNTIRYNMLYRNANNGARFTGNNNELTGNHITFNQYNGVTVAGSGLGNSIRRNLITANDKMGIDLGGTGFTPNDYGGIPDNDTGPNNLQNFPFIAIASHDDSSVTVSGYLITDKEARFTLDFYLNAACDYPYNNGEGHQHIGSMDITTDSVGIALFSTNFTVSPLDVPGWIVTSTSTSTNGDTSEFSSCQVVEYQPSLRIRVEGDHLILYWREEGTGTSWQLQWSPFSLLPALDWHDLDVTGHIEVVGGETRVTEPFVAGGRLYRLRRIFP